jgi:spore germination cell wall hydrolase CwlJ-like protein
MSNRRYQRQRRRGVLKRLDAMLTELRWHWFARSGERSFVRGVRLFAVAFLAGAGLAWIHVTNSGQQLQCLTENVYHEARGENEAGQLAVAQVTMNRVASRHYPDTVCEVVYEKRWDRIRGRFIGMFSWTELDRDARIDPIAWQRAHDAAIAVYNGYRDPELEGALFYHADYVNPSWARSQVRVARIGSHIFYR